MTRSTRGRTRGNGDGNATLSPLTTTPNGYIGTPSAVIGIMERPDLDDQYDSIVKAYSETMPTWRKRDDFLSEMSEANPYEKALVVNGRADNQTKRYPDMLDDGLPFYRSSFGTQWRYEHPEGDAIAQANGLHDYDLVGIADGEYAFDEHSDRFAYMSDDHRAYDTVTRHTFKMDEALIDDNTRRAMEFAQRNHATDAKGAPRPQTCDTSWIGTTSPVASTSMQTRITRGSSLLRTR